MNRLRAIIKPLQKILKGRDRGSVAIQFILTLPILLTILGVLVQYALLVNAKLTMERALASAARSAMTALPTNQMLGEAGGPDAVRRAALMVLESLSPKAESEVSTEAQTVANALASVGLPPPDGTYAARYTYAQAATEVSISGGNYATSPGERITLTISYDFRLTVPGVNALIGRSDTVAGIEGRFRRFTSSVEVQLSPGREAGTGGAP